MTGIVFYFENSDKDVWSGRYEHLDAWNYAMQLTSDVRTAVVVNQTNHEFTSFNKSCDIQYVTEIPALEGHVTHIVCPWDAGVSTSMWDFDHLTDWYVFGPAGGWLGYTGAAADKQVYIPQNGIGAIHSVHAATAVMAHRYGVLG